MQKPEISVIVPVYKVEQYLDRCLNSIVGQTFSDLEIILVDDGSPDSCPKRCDDWAQKDSRIRVLHQKNSGVSAARNAGLAAAKGAYISFADADDWLEPNMLQYLYDLLTQHPDAQLAQCEPLFCSDEAPIDNKQPENIRVFGKTEMLDYFFRIHGESSNDAIWNKLYRRELLEGFAFVNTQFEDVEASYEFFHRADKMVVSDWKLYHYFMNTASFTKSQFKRNNLDYLAVWERIVKRTAQEYPAYVQYAEMGRKRAGFTLLAKMTRLGYDKSDAEMKAIKKRLKKEVRQNFGALMRWNMPVSRKVLLLLLCI